MTKICGKTFEFEEVILNDMAQLLMHCFSNESVHVYILIFMSQICSFSSMRTMDFYIVHVIPLPLFGQSCHIYIVGYFFNNYYVNTH